MFKQREELRRENEQLKKELESVRYDNELLRETEKYLQEENEELKARSSVDESFQDVFPEDGEKRQQLLADITMHYQRVMNNQLGKMIDDQKEELSKIGLPAEYAQIYRSNINCLRLIKGFYERCEAEYMGVLQEQRGELEDN